MAYSIEGACVDIEFLIMGPIENNVYLISKGEGVIVVDPTQEAHRIMDALGERSCIAIVLTHRHHDHIGAASELRDLTGAPVIASAVDAEVISGEAPVPGSDRPITTCPMGVRVNHGDVIELGGMPWKVILTPGHTPGSTCFFLDPRFGNHPEGTPVLISGDTLFCGAVGRTDFAGGSMEDMKHSLKRLAVLPDETLVLPGHNAQTTIGAERQRIFARFAI